MSFEYLQTFLHDKFHMMSKHYTVYTIKYFLNITYILICIILVLHNQTCQHANSLFISFKNCFYIAYILRQSISFALLTSFLQSLKSSMYFVGVRSLSKHLVYTQVKGSNFTLISICIYTYLYLISYVEDYAIFVVCGSYFGVYGGFK